MKLKNLALALFSAVTALLTVSGVANAAPAAPAPLVVNVDKGLPSRITLEPGQEVVFVRHKHLVGSGVSVKQIQIDRMVPNLFKQVTGDAGDPDFYVVGAWSVTREGTGAVDVTHTITAPRAKPSTKRVVVTVQTAALSPVVVDVDGPLPATVTLKKGQKLLLVRKKGLVGSSVKAEIEQTDRRPGELFAPATGTVGGQYEIVDGVEALRLGNGHARVSHRPVVPGAQWTTKTVKILVR